MAGAGGWAQVEACKAESGKDPARSALRPREKFCEDAGPLNPNPRLLTPTGSGSKGVATQFLLGFFTDCNGQ